MAIKLYINNVEYTKHIVPNVVPQLDDLLNQPKVLTFALYPADSTFNVVTEGERVRFESDSKVIFTGWVTATPEREIVSEGYSGYNVICQSDEWVYSQAGLPAKEYVGRTAGDILIDLLLLAGGEADTTHVQAGTLIPYFRVEDGWTFVEAAEQLCSQNGYRWFILDGYAYLSSQNDTSYGFDINADSPNFNSAEFNITRSNVDVVNDATTLGGSEPRVLAVESFLGDSVSTSYDLSEPMFGNTFPTTLFSDFFGSNVLDETMWWSAGSFSYSRYSLVVNGNAIITAKNTFELGGELSFKHGLFQFNNLSNGILGGLYAGDDCVAGFNLTAATPYTGIQPMVNGVLVGSQFVTAPNHSYELRTYVSADEKYRYNKPFKAITGSFGGDVIPSDGFVTFAVIDTNLSDPNATPVTTILYDGRVSNLPAFGEYRLVDGNMVLVATTGPQVDRLPDVRVRSSVVGRVEPTIFNNAISLPYTPSNTDAITVWYRGTGQAQSRLRNTDSVTNVGVKPVTLSVSSQVRTSADCENLLQAYLSNHAQPLYEGNYVSPEFTLNTLPVSGRMVNVNYPNVGSEFASVVTHFKVYFTDLAAEKVRLYTSFGSAALLDNYSEVKVLGSIGFNDFTTVPTSLSSLSSIVSNDIFGDHMAFNFGTSRFVEVRTTDSNWGATEPSDYVGTFTTTTQSLPRTSRTDTYYIRVRDNGATPKYSRNVTVLRATGYPIKPAAPTASITIGQKTVYTATVSNLNDVAGVEIRTEGDVLIARVPNTNGTFVYEEDNSVAKNRTYTNIKFLTYNSRMEYSDVATVSASLAVPATPTVTLQGNTNGLNFNVNLSTENRSDIIEETLEVADSNTFTNIVFTDKRGSQFSSSAISMAAAGTYYVRARKSDILGYGSNTVTPLEITVADINLTRPLATAPTVFSVATNTYNPSTKTTDVKIQWTKTDGVAYEIRYGTSQTTYSYQVVADVSSAIITGLKPNTLYYYCVGAINADGKRAYGTDATFTSSASATPANVTGFTVFITGINAVTLKWNANSESDVVGYHIKRGSTDVVLRHNSTSFTDTGLNASTAYTWYIWAVNADGTESAASASCSTTTDAAASTIINPEAPATFTVSNLSTGYVVGFDGKITNWINVNLGARGSNTAFRRVYIAPAGGNYTTYETDNTDLRIEPLLPSVTYSVYYINISSSNTSSTASAVASITTDKNTLPVPAPTITTIAAAVETALIKWSSGASDIAYYVVERAPDNGSNAPGTWATVAPRVVGTIYTDSGLTAGTKYWWRVTAWNTSGTASPNSTAVSQTTGYIPSGSGLTPSGPVAAPSLSATTPNKGVDIAQDGTVTAFVLLDLAAMATGTVSHQLRYKKTSDSIYQSFSTTDLTVRIGGLLPNTSYDFNYANVGVTGVASTYSATLTTTTSQNSTSPNNPRNLVVKCAIETAVVTWDVPLSSLDIAYYTVERSTDNLIWTTVASHEVGTSFGDSKLNPGQIYYYRVQAFNTSGASSGYVSASDTTGYIPSSMGTQPTAPGAGPTISASGVEASQGVLTAWVDLTMNTTSDTVAHSVRYRKTGDTNYISIVTAENIIKIRGLLPNTSYDYGYANIGATGLLSGYSTNTTATSAKNNGPVAAPTGVTASTAVNTALITWNASADSDIAYYAVDRAPDNSGVAGVWANVAPRVQGTIFSDVNLAANTKYWWRVTAYNTSGVASSAAVTSTWYQTQVDTGTPITPSNPASAPTLNSRGVNVSADGTVLAWVEVNLPAMPGDTTYRRIRIRQTAASNYMTYQTTDTIFRFEGLLPNTNYTINYQNVGNTGIPSTYSSDFTVTTTLNTGVGVVAQVTGLTLTPGFRVMALNWNAVSGNDIAYYLVERSTDGGATYPYNFKAFSNYTIDNGNSATGLSLSTTYTYRVSAFNTSGQQGSVSTAASNTCLAIGTTDMVANTINANVLQSQSVKALQIDVANLISSGINGGSTLIDGGKVLISGSTTLANWRGSDTTKIAGGSIETNTVTAAQLTIGPRGIDVVGINFSSTGNTLSWTSGTISYINTSGVGATQAISSGSVVWTSGTVYIYWTVGSGTLSTSTTLAGSIGANNITLCTYNGGFLFYPTYGRTIITGDYIATQSIVAGNIKAGDITGNEIHADTIDTAHLKANSITSTKILAGEVKAANIASGAVTASKLFIGSGAGDAANDIGTAVNSAYVAINSGKITLGNGALLSSWQGGTNNTEISGGAIATSSITAAKLQIGARGVDVQGINFSNSTNLIWNGNFASYASATTPDGVQTADAFGTIVNNPTNAHSGNTYLQISKSVIGYSETVYPYMECAAGDVINASLWYYLESGSWGYVYLQLTFLDASNVLLGSAINSTFSGGLGAWRQGVLNNITAPVNTAKLRFRIVSNLTSNGTAVARVGDVVATRTKSGQSSPVANTLTWTAGTIAYIDNSGSNATVTVRAGGLQGLDAGTMQYVYWTVGNSNLSTSATQAGAYGINNITFCTYTSGTAFFPTYGRTTITGDYIATGSITAGNIAAGSITTNEIGALQVKTANIDAEAVTAAKIKALDIDSTRIKAGAITADKLFIGTIPADAANDIGTAVNNAYVNISAGKIVVDSGTSTMLSSWSAGAGKTTIAGGKIETASISADKVQVGLRGVDVSGLNFYVDTNIVFNNDFESGSSFWKFDANATLQTDNTKSHSGNSYLQIQGLTSTYRTCMHTERDNTTTRYFPCQAGDVINVTGWAYRESGDQTLHYMVSVVDSNKTNNIYHGTSNLTTTGVWTQLTDGGYTIPATVAGGAAPAYFYVYAEITNTGTVNSVGRFDDVVITHTRAASSLRNVLKWTAGNISYTDNTNTPQIQAIAAGSAVWDSGTKYIYWTVGNNYLAYTGTQASAYGTNNVMFCTYTGSTNYFPTYGRTTITGDWIATGTVVAANIAAGSISSSHIAANQVDTTQLNASAVTSQKIAAGAITASKIYVGPANGGLDDIGNAVNAATVKIDGGQILVSGSNTLLTWRDGSDTTLIAGGKIAANTVTAAQLTIAPRGVDIQGINFSNSGNTLSWTAGTIYYYNTSGVYTSQAISSGSVAWTSGTVWVYWTVGNASLSTSTTQAGSAGANNITLCTYNGGTSYFPTYGRTTITGDYIATGTIQAGNIQAGTITGTEIHADTIQASHLKADSVTAVAIAAGSITTAKLDTVGIDVGGGSGMPGKLRVFDNVGNPIGYIGKYRNAANTADVYGGWFKNLSIGGSDQDHPVFTTDGTSIAQLVGDISMSNASQIVVKDGTNATIGYIGKFASTLLGANTYGGWFKTLGVGGTKDTPQLYADASGNLVMVGGVIKDAAGNTILAPGQTTLFPSTSLSQTLTLTPGTGTDTLNGDVNYYITLTITPSATINDFDGYLVKFRKGSDNYTSIYSVDNTIKINGLLENTSYSISVQAYDKLGRSTTAASTSQTTPTYSVTGVVKLNTTSPKNFWAVPDPDSNDNDPAIDADFVYHTDRLSMLAQYQKRVAILRKINTVNSIAHLAIGNLSTSEKFFDHFHVEVYPAGGGTTIFKGDAQGVWNAATSTWDQKDIVVPDLKRGGTYDIKAYVVAKNGRISSAVTATNVAVAANGTITGYMSGLMYSTGVTVDSLRPAEAGAEVTTGKSVDILTDGQNFVRTSSRAFAVNLDNADFEASASLLPPPGWINGHGPSSSVHAGTLSYETVSPYGGAGRSLKVDCTQQYSGVAQARTFAVKAGEQYNLSAAVKVASAGHSVILSMWFLDGSGTYIAPEIMNSSTSTSWTVLTASGTVPNNAVTAYIHIISGNAGTCTFWVDSVSCQRVISFDTEVFDGQINAKTTWTEKKASQGVFIETFDTPISGAPWTQLAGASAAVSYPSNGNAGGKVLRYAGSTAGNASLWLEAPALIPFDPSKLYRMRFRVRKTAGTTNSICYAGVTAFAADATTPINAIGGVSDHSSAHYFVATGCTVPNDSQWYEFTGYLKGTQATNPYRNGYTTVNTAGAANNVSTPCGLTSAAKYFKPMFIINYQNPTTATDDWEIDYIAIDIIPESVDIVPDGTNRYTPRIYPTFYQNDLPYNGSFETWPDTSTLPDGWTPNFEVSGSGATFARVTGSVGNFALQITSSVGGGSAAASRAFAVQGGVKYTLSARARSTVNNTGSAYIRILFYKDDVDMTRNGTSLCTLGAPQLTGAGFYDVLGNSLLPSAWTLYSGSVVAPPDAKYARVAVYAWTGVSAALQFDTLSVVSTGVYTDALGDGAVTAAKRVTGAVIQDVSENRIWNNWCNGNAGVNIGAGDGQPAVPTGTGYSLLKGSAAVLPSFSGDGRILMPINGAGNTCWVYVDNKVEYVGLPGDTITISCQVMWADNSLPNPNGSVYFAIYGVNNLSSPTGSSVNNQQGLNLANGTSWTTYTATFNLPTDVTNVVWWKIHFGITNETAKACYIRRLQISRGAECTRWTSAVARDPLGQVPSGGGSGSTGGGGGYGDPGGGSNCFTGNVRILTPNGLVRFDELPTDEEFEVVNEFGIREARLIVHENCDEQMIEFIPRTHKLVTMQHLMKSGDVWPPAFRFYADKKRVWFNGKLYNLHIVTDDEREKQYILETGDVAHNAGATKASTL